MEVQRKTVPQAEQGRSPRESLEDEDAIRDIPRRMIEAWNAGDGAAFAAPFTDSADFIAFEGTRLKGRARIAAFHQDVFDTVIKGSRLGGAAGFVRFLGPELAVMHALATTTLPGGTRPSPSRNSMQLFVVVKSGGTWQVEALMNARRLSLEQQLQSDDLHALPAPFQVEAAAFIAKLKERHVA